MTPLLVDLDKFKSTFNALNGRVKYDLGGKVARLNTAPQSVTRSIDCSGWERYQIYQSSGVIIPDGSWIQREWCEQNLEQVPYGPANGFLMIAFLTAGVNGVGNVGHVWNVWNGDSFECYYGHGVGSRKWDTPILKNHVHKAFRLPTKVASKGYSLYASDQHLIKVLPVDSGRSYVAARDWGMWFKQQVYWDGFKVFIDGVPIADSKLVFEDGRNVAYIPFTIAADLTGVSYVVDNTKREIRLKPQV